MKHVDFLEVTQCGSSMNRRSSEKSVLTRNIRSNITEDGILQRVSNLYWCSVTEILKIKLLTGEQQ
jgi:hypothetical protein